jgi:hypothetical protein
MRSQEKFVYEDDELQVEFVIGQATTAEGIRRVALQARAEASESPPSPDEEGRYRWFKQRWEYPACIAGTTNIRDIDPEKPSGITLDMSFEDWLNLPDALTATWAERVVAKNPHWNPFFRASATRGDGSMTS